jgi:hypothetical protein
MACCKAGWLGRTASDPKSVEATLYFWMEHEWNMALLLLRNKFLSILQVSD